MRERAHELARKRVKDRVEEEARKYEGTVRDPFLRRLGILSIPVRAVLMGVVLCLITTFLNDACRLDAFSSLSTTDYRQYSDKVIQDVFGSSVAARIQELSSAQAQTPDLVAQTIQEFVLFHCVCICLFVIVCLSVHACLCICTFCVCIMCLYVLHWCLNVYLVA